MQDQIIITITRPETCNHEKWREIIFLLEKNGFQQDQKTAELLILESKTKCKFSLATMLDMLE